MKKQEMYTLPCGTVTDNPKLAAELWAEAFYEVRDALDRIRPVPAMIQNRLPVRNLDEIYAECDRAMKLGERP